MPRFIAVHTATISEQALKALAKEVPLTGVSWKLTYCDFNDNKFFCEWEARNKEELQQVFKVMNMPFNAIYPVRLFNVAKGDFED